MVFPVVRYGCESWTIKKAEHQRIDAFELLVLEKTLESPLYCKEIKPVHPKGNQSWIFTDAEAETPILWPPDAKNWLIGKYPDAGKDWRQEEKGTTPVFLPGESHGQRSLASYSPWDHKESDIIAQLTHTYIYIIVILATTCILTPHSFYVAIG